MNNQQDIQASLADRGPRDIPADTSSLHAHPADSAANPENCIFCKIASGKIPAMKIYEDEYTVAFLDIQPVNAGHTLVIPKDHFENIYTTPDELWCRVMLTVKKMALALKHAVNADGINLEMNNERAAGQLVAHAHVHVIPRHNDDGLTHWPGKAYKDAAEAEAIVAKIQAELKEIAA